MDLQNLQLFILDKLHDQLPEWLTYHNAEHTEQIIKHAIELGEHEGLSNEEIKLLHTAAIMHDTGFLSTYTNHEKASCKLSKEILPQFGYNNEQINSINEMIMATCLPQSPKNRSSEILCDADLYYLGTKEYRFYSGRLLRELKHSSPDLSNKEWLLLQKDFLEGHKYFTAAAKKKLNAGKKINLKYVRSSHKKHKQTHSDFKIADIILMLCGAVIAGFSLKGFLIPNNFLDGGVTGISLLVHEVYGFNFSRIVILVNVPLIILGLYVVNKRFAAKTLASIICLGLCVLYIPYPIIVTPDKLLISVFGGFFAGVGMGLTIRAGSALDGIEVLALYTFKRSGFTMSEIILAINAIIFIIAAFHFGIQTALYSMLTYFTATKTVDYVVEGIEAYTGVTIISGNSERIKEKLVTEMGRGITIYKGERGFLPGKYEVHSDVDIIFTVITRLELRRLKNLVYAEDPKAFVFANTIKETAGGILKRRAAH